ncbi:MAG: PAS domain S-box protein [Desulfobulbaceae bacterium]|uniref:histidine kinase n=1 Tax=Candidatus Desulfobia pelagia TaxID=2841692 RepID=A0A8J6NF55_9BACT|nr:PAS domain S-box protein [Candidatus Desulfobia pelagia]
MKLRLILLVLSLLAIFSASTGGYFYYTSLKKYALQEAEGQAEARLEIIKKNISSFLSENVRPVKTLAGIDEMGKVLENRTDVNQGRAEAVLDLFRESLDVDVCYLMNSKGITVASSNRGTEDSFMDKYFGFRPYFIEAMNGSSATYMALGITSGKRGCYSSYPVYSDHGSPIGVAVIKRSIELIESELGLLSGESILVVDPQGIVFIADHREWLYHSMYAFSESEVEQVAASRQFGKGPWLWTGLQQTAPDRMKDRVGGSYLFNKTELDSYPGWHIIHLRDLKMLSRAVSAPLIRITGHIVIVLCFFIGLSVFFLYRKASVEIQQRRLAEEALRESDKRYRSLYNDTPAMLHSIDRNGRLLSVSNYWLEKLGHKREDVIGRNLTDFYTGESKKYAEEIVIPEFFRTGNCSDVPYQFVKKNGEIIDVLLAAIGVRDQDGILKRSLAVSVDVTERKYAEEMLRQAKEELSTYSRDLEKQVKERTKEIQAARDHLRRLSASIMNSQEQERKAFARELHDELGQVLTALRMDTVWLHKRLLQKQDDGALRALAMCDLIDKTIDEVRGMAFRLRPGVLDDLGLVDALEVYTADFERRTGITTIFQSGAIYDVDSTIATASYRITQEALTNVARHASAAHVDVVLDVSKKKLQLTIRDDGCGFVIGNPSESEGLGIAGMMERAVLAGGELDVESYPGEGTRISFSVVMGSILSKNIRSAR